MRRVKSNGFLSEERYPILSKRGPPCTRGLILMDCIDNQPTCEAQSMVEGVSIPLVPSRARPTLSRVVAVRPVGTAVVEKLKRIGSAAARGTHTNSKANRATTRNGKRRNAVGVPLLHTGHQGTA